MLSPRQKRMVQEFHERLGITSSTYEPFTNSPGTLFLTTPDGVRYLVVDTDLGLWYEVWNNQRLPQERYTW